MVSVCRNKKPRPLPTTPSSGPSSVTPGRGAPMDIDRARRQGLCFNCQERGHLAKDCPKPRRQPQGARRLLIDPETMSEDDYKLVIGCWEMRQKSKKVEDLNLGQWKESEIADL